MPIIKSEEQFWLPENQRGDDNAEITDVPQGFKTWVANNQDRIAKAERRGTLPYFVRDNRERIYYSLITDNIRNSGKISSNVVVPNGRILDYNISKEEAVQRLRELAINYTHEEAYIFLSDNRVYHKVGVLNKVPFTVEECKLFEGGVLMHNHPTETFSPEDIAFAMKHRIRDIRVITPNKQYRAVLPPELLDDFNYERVKNKIESIKDALSKRMMNFNSKKYEKYLSNFHNYAMRDFFRLEGIKYFVNSFD